jgi:predicted DNA-binding ribbon-helix-helix protein
MIQRSELSFEKMKRSIVIAGHKTSLSLEAAFWVSLKEIAALEGTPVSQLVNRINAGRDHANLSSAVRLYVLDHYRGMTERGPTVKGKR